MHALLSKRIEIPESWVGAFLFAFKFLTVVVAVLLLVWHALLPPNHTNVQRGIDMVGYSAAYDFAMVASSVSLFYFLASAVLVIGGVIQLFKYSRRAAIWSIGFGVAALVIGIFLAAFLPWPIGGIQDFRGVA